MIKKGLHKLRSQRGESLMEVLCAILILALSCAMIAGVTRAAIQLNRQANTATEAYYTQLTDAEAHSTASSGTLRVDGVDIPITISGTSGGLRTYTLAEESTP